MGGVPASWAARIASEIRGRRLEVLTKCGAEGFQPGHDAREILHAMPTESVHLAITSPPYNVGLQYDSHNDRMPYDEYLKWLMGFWAELYRVLVPGGRFALNVAPTSIRDFRPVHYDMAHDLMQLGFIMRTEILWHKQTMRRRTAWGSWKSPSNPHMVPS